MKVFRSLLAVLFATSLLANSVLGVHAQEKGPTLSSSVTTVLAKSSKDINATDISLVVDIALQNKISVEKLAKFMSSLNPEQYSIMRSMILERLDISVPATLQKASGAALPSKISPQAGGYAYVETIENVWTWNYNPKIFASSYYNDAYCDGDGSDMDYVFYYPVSTSATLKANLRWTTTNAAVYSAFMAAYGGNLSAFGWSYSEVRLCLGSAAWAVGLNNVANSVFIHY